MLVIRNDFSIDCRASIDLIKKKSTTVYSAKSLLDSPLRFSLSSPLLARGKNLDFSLGNKEKQEQTVDNDLTITALSGKTYYLEYRPYLTMRDNTEKMLVADFKLDFQIKMPLNARIIKSSIPLTVETDGTAAFKIEKIRAIPPVLLWYTTADENISVEKKVTDKTDTVTVQVDLKNLSTNAVNRILIITQFPNDFFTPDEENSYGTFKLIDNVMIKWQAIVDRIGAREGKSVKFTLIKNDPNYQHKNFEILLYNQDGELINIK